MEIGNEEGHAVTRRPLPDEHLRGQCDGVSPRLLGTEFANALRVD
jgi:hypothetical protein